MTVRPSKGIEYVLAADDPKHGENAKLGGGSQRTRKGKKATQPPLNAPTAARKLPRINAGRTVLALRERWGVGDAGVSCDGSRFGVKAAMLTALHDPGDRKALSRSIRDLAGPADPAAVEAMIAWPPR